MTEIGTNLYCLRPWYKCFLMSNGDVAPCCMQRCGKLRDNTKPGDAWNLPRARKLRRLIVEGKPPWRCTSHCSPNPAIWPTDPNNDFSALKRWLFKPAFTKLPGRPHANYEENANLVLREAAAGAVWLSSVAPYWSFGTTLRCNLRCKGCPGVPLDGEGVWYNEREPDFYKPYLDYVLDQHTKIQVVRFGAGEPSIQRVYQEFFRRVKEEQPHFQLEMAVNGTRIDYGLVERGCVAQLSIAINAYSLGVWKELTNGTDEDFRRQQDTLRRLSENPGQCRVSVSFLIWTGNIAELPLAIRKYEGMGFAVRSWFMLPYGTGRPEWIVPMQDVPYMENALAVIGEARGIAKMGMTQRGLESARAHLVQAIERTKRGVSWDAAMAALEDRDSGSSNRTENA